VSFVNLGAELCGKSAKNSVKSVKSVKPQRIVENSKEYREIG
jgi:hypothetical protein